MEAMGVGHTVNQSVGKTGTGLETADKVDSWARVWDWPRAATYPTRLLLHQGTAPRAASSGA